MDENGETLERMAEALRIEEINRAQEACNATTTTTAAAGGQRSRRSSGYASASSSPTTGAKRLLSASSAPITAAASPHDDSATEISQEPAVSSLYELTLRWMFDGYVVESDDSDPPIPDEPASKSVADQSGSEPATTSDGTSSTPATVLRMYIHLFRRHSPGQPRMTPSLIEFVPVTSAAGCQEEEEKKEESYVLHFQDGHPSPPTLFPR